MPTISCPRCTGTLDLAAEHVGWQVRCPHCGAEFAAGGTAAQSAPGGYPPPHYGYGPPRTPQDTVEYAARQVYGPGLALQIVGWVMAGLTAAGAAALGLLLAFLPNAGPRNDDVGRVVAAVMFAAGGAFSFAYFAVMAYGGGRMKSLRGYGWGLAGSIMAIVSVLGLCVGFGVFGVCGSLVVLPFGVWGLVVMLNPEVKAGFYLAAASTTPPAGGNDF